MPGRYNYEPLSVERDFRFWHLSDVSVRPTTSDLAATPATSGSPTMSVENPIATWAVHSGIGFDIDFNLSKYSFEPIQCCLPSLGVKMRRRDELRSVQDRARLSNVETTARENDGSRI
jgi:hypothetical protein